MIHRFEPSHFSKGNHFFQTTIEIDDLLRTVTLQRTRLIGSETVTILAQNITTVTLNTRTEYFYLCEITLTIFGSETFILNGFNLADARTIKEFINQIKQY